ncbi:MAG: FG-GAP-like repeat-containing protein [Proteobacteria bacterium]|nr:FG-GAP-like repeat-containing protein [Pseudomonadota bacterium]
MQWMKGQQPINRPGWLKIWRHVVCAALIAGSAGALGCTAAVDGRISDEELGVARQPFRVTWWLDRTVMQRAHSTVTICLYGSGMTRANRVGREWMLRQAFDVWFRAAEGASTVPLTRRNDIRFRCRQQHLNVNWSNVDGRAFALPTRWPNEIYLYSRNGYATVLHEVGHVLSLGDTYWEGVWGDCQPGQLDSVMCGGYSTLQPDDVYGIREAYCATFPDHCNRLWRNGVGFCRLGGLYAGDFNGDGADDLLCDGGLRSSSAMEVYLANRRGQFDGTDWSGLSGWCTGEIHTGDFNGDGNDDILCNNTRNGHKSIVYANASGQFSRARQWNAPLGWCYRRDELHIGDFNGDGNDDMLCTNTRNGHKYILYADAAGRFSRRNQWNAPLGWCYRRDELHIGDFNRDGHDDMLCHDPDHGNKWITLARRDGSFGRQDWSHIMGFCYGNAPLYVGDFNNDDRDDMACLGWSGTSSISLADVDGEFDGVQRQWEFNWCNDPGNAVIGDFDGNGSDDLLCRRGENFEIRYQYR